MSGNSYNLKRSPGQNSLIAFFVMVLAFVTFGVLPTQWFAAKFQYDPNLGEPVVRALGVALYYPTDWVRWGLRLSDVRSLESPVHTMLVLGAIAALAALVLSVLVARTLNRGAVGMAGLHGTAHFAEWPDVDATGFADALGHTASGVVVGSVLLDWRGRVIHPNHKKFAKRYKAVIKRPWREGFRAVAVRDSNQRPMFVINRFVVRKVKLLRDGGNTHVFAFCPTRSAKGTAMVLPTLYTWRHSVFVNDPKGEAYALSAGFRQAAGQNIIKFEPACVDGTGARWNPLDEIELFTLFDVSQAQMIMAMACDPKGEGLHDYFDKAGYEFLTALALHVRYEGNDGSLAGCARFLGDPGWDSDKQMYLHMINFQHDPDFTMGWVDSMGAKTATHPMIANAAKTMLNKEDKDRSGVLSTAKALLSLYLDPIVAMNTSCSDFLVRDLMTGEKPVSLYYVVEPKSMETMVPLTRLFYALFIRRNASDMKFKEGRSVAGYTHKLLMIIDEATSLQKMPILQEALGYVAGYGIRMFTLVQDIAQLLEMYGEHQSFDSGAETRVAYAPNKVGTAELLARMVGKTTITEQTTSVSQDVVGIKGGSVSVSVNKTARDLLTADEILSLHDRDVIIFVKGKPVIYGSKSFYFENAVMVGRASMPAPLQSARLRVAKVGSIGQRSHSEVPEVAPIVDPITVAWQAGRVAMGDKLALAAPGQPAAVAATDLPVSADPVVVDPAVTPEKTAVVRRSRYMPVDKPLSADQQAVVAKLVADVALVGKIMKINAFD